MYTIRDQYTTDPQAGKLAEDAVLYAAIVMQVQLLKGGNMFHGDASSLAERGWGLYKCEESEQSKEAVNRICSCRTAAQQGEEAPVQEGIAALKQEANHTAVWHPHKDGNCAMLSVTGTKTPVFKLASS